MLFTIPEPPPVPPYLRWSWLDRIAHTEPGAFRVAADLFQSGKGWTWTAEYTPIVVVRRDESGEPVYADGETVKADPSTHPDEAEAKAACERWITRNVNPNPPDDDTVKVILVGDLDAAAVAELVGEHAIVIVGTRAAIAAVARLGVLYQRVDTARLGAALGVSDE